MIDHGGMLPERAPVDHPLDPRNRPIPPCLALESRRSTAGEVMLLGRLVQRRRESPEEAWFDSYAAAWREAGRPEPSRTSWACCTRRWRMPSKKESSP